MLKLYDFALSGNCYKARLMLSLLNLEHKIISLDLKSSEHKSLEFLRLNLFGQVPVLVDENTMIRESQAILVYLARCYGGNSWLPSEAEPMSLVMQWLFTAAHDIQQGLAAARAYHLVGRQLDIETATQRSHTILTAINQHLARRQWLELNCPTIADIACFPYIALAADGKIALDNYANVTAWLARIKQLPGYVELLSL
ncbi:MAG: glutathione S-transferase [Stenomitos rutilans HA7619-LM2]|jgi:glutathione S-transferase|nr:glutathione S-transferase [Stenomitos rutilans HA7619-LM2]